MALIKEFKFLNFLLLNLLILVHYSIANPSLIKLGGKVYENGGLNPLSGIMVTYLFNGVSTSVITDSNGTYLFPQKVTSGEFILKASCSNAYGSYIYASPQKVPCPFSFSSKLILNEDSTLVNLVAPPFYLVTLSVIDSAENPIPNFYVRPSRMYYSYTPGDNYVAVNTESKVLSSINQITNIEWWNGNSAEYAFYLKTDENGKCVFAIFSDGQSYSFLASLGRALKSQAATSASVVINSDMNIIIKMAPVVSISGTVVDAKRELSYSGLAVEWKNPFSANQWLATDVNGKFSIPSVSGGDMTIKISNTGMSNYPGCFLTILKFNLQDSTSPDDFTVTLPSHIAIVVTVLNVDGTAASGIKIYASQLGSTGIHLSSVLAIKGSSLIDPSSNFVDQPLGMPESLGCNSGSAYTNSLGQATLHFFKQDDVQIHINAQSKFNTDVSQALYLTDDQAVVIKLAPTKVLYGQLTTVDRYPRPIENAGIAINIAGRGVYTNSTGYFYFDSLPLSVLSLQTMGSLGPNSPNFFEIWGSFDTRAEYANPVLITLPTVLTYHFTVINQLNETVNTAKLTLDPSTTPENYGISCDGVHPYVSGPVGMNCGGFENMLAGLHPSANTGVIVDEFAHGSISTFKGNVGDKLHLICSDTANSARVGELLFPIDGSELDFKCILPSVPSPPRELSIAPKNTTDSFDLYNSVEAELSWDPPVTDGGFPLLDYTITVNLTESLDASVRRLSADTANGVQTLSVGADKTSAIVKWLKPATKYTVSVKANNLLGFSKASIAKLETDSFNINSPTSLPSSSVPSSSAPFSSSPTSSSPSSFSPSSSSPTSSTPSSSSPTSSAPSSSVTTSLKSRTASPTTSAPSSSNPSNMNAKSTSPSSSVPSSQSSTAPSPSNPSSSKPSPTPTSLISVVKSRDLSTANFNITQMFSGLDTVTYYKEVAQNEQVLKSVIAKVAGLKDPKNVRIYSIFQSASAIPELQSVTAAVKYGISFSVLDYSGSSVSGYQIILSAITNSVKSGEFTNEIQASSPPGSALSTVVASTSAPLLASPVVYQESSPHPTLSPTFGPSDSALQSVIIGIPICGGFVLLLIAYTVFQSIKTRALNTNKTCVTEDENVREECKDQETSDLESQDIIFKI